MARSVICPSCGNRQSLPDDFDRRKVRCAQCGVMCPVEDAPAPVPARKKAAPVEDEEETAARLLDEVEAPSPPPATPTRRPSAEVTPPNPLPTPAPEPEQERREFQDQDDGKPYLVDGGVEERNCPRCLRVMERDAVVCLGCGLDLRKGKKLKRTFEPMERAWDLGMPFALRIKLFIAAVLIGIGLSMASAYFSSDWSTPLGGWFFFTVMLAFLLGSFFHVHLSRDKKGRVKLTRTWRICFIAKPPEQIDVLEYHGVRCDLVSEFSFLEWIIFFDLLLYGIIPGILFLVLVMNRDRQVVVLTKDHGYADIILYKGTDAALAREVTSALRDGARLREETS